MNMRLAILTQITLQILSKGPISNKSSLFQIVARHQTGDNQLSEPKNTWITDANMHPSESLTSTSIGNTVQTSYINI